MTPEFINSAWLIALLSAIVNAAVVYGVITTKLSYMARDLTRVDEKATAAHIRLDKIHAPGVWGEIHPHRREDD